MNKNILRYTTIILLFLLLVPFQKRVNAQDVIYVDPDITVPIPDGASWATAYTSLQQAIDSASSTNVDTIKVALDTVQLSANLKINKNPADPYKEVVIIGGFDPSTGEQVGYTTLDGQNTVRILDVSFLSNATIFDGLIFYRGRAYAGGGLHNYQSDPTIRNVQFIDNHAYDDGSGTLGHGAAILNDGSSPVFENCVFKDNESELFGGAISNFNNPRASSPFFSNVTFENNQVTNGSGGVFLCSPQTSLTLYDVEFKNNSAKFAGAIYANQTKTLDLDSVVFESNSATNLGGAIYANNIEDSLELNNVVFTDNTAVESGGGIYNDSSTVIINNSIFYKNISGYGGGISDFHGLSVLSNVLFCENETSSSGGGGIFIWDQPYNYATNSTYTTLNNVTFYGNTLSNSGGVGAGLGIYSQNTNCYPVLNNTVFYGNTIVGTTDDIGGWASSGLTSNINSSSTNNASDASGGNIASSTNFIALTSDPFMDSTNPIGDDLEWRTDDDGLIPLCESGPLYNAGDNTSVSETVDLKGEERIFNTTVDIGAYESQEIPLSYSPGGINSDLRLWLRADRGTGSDINSVPTEGTTVSTWLNQIGTRDAFSGDEVYSTTESNMFNFNPVVVCDGAGSYSLNNGTLTTSSNSLDYFIVFRANSGTASALFHSGANRNNVSTGYHWWARLLADNRVSTFMSGSTTGNATGSRGTDFDAPIMTGFRYNKGNKYAYSFVNGKQVGQARQFNVNRNCYKRTRNVSHYILAGMNGEVGEVIAYPSSYKSNVDYQKVNSYLALKYGITLNNGATDYLASDSTVMWDASENTGYINNIFGLGRDDVDSLYQRISKSENSTGALIASLNDDFTSSNLASSRQVETIPNKEFMTFSNNGADTLLARSSNVPDKDRILLAMNRIWRVSETNDFPDSISLKFGVPHLDSLTYMVYKTTGANGDFTSGTSTFLGVLNEDGEINNVQLNNGEYFSLFIPKTPGGVTGGVFWYRADITSTLTLSGTSATDWADFSGYGNDLTSRSSNGKPEYNRINLNFNPSLIFTSDFLFTDSANINKLQGTTDFEVFSVAYRTGGTGTILYYGSTNSAGSSGYAFDLSATVNVRDGSGYKYLTPSKNITDYHLYNFRHNGLGYLGDIYAWMDNDSLAYSAGGQLTSTTSVNGSTVTMGYRMTSGSNNPLTGAIAETFIYPRVLSIVERQKVQSYLALKYGMTLDQSNGDYDYLASDSTRIWDASDAVIDGVAFNHDIFGIGCDSISALYQRISKSVNDSAIITLSLNNDFVGANISRTEEMNNLSFQTISNNGGAKSWGSETTASNGYIFLKRKWLVQEAGSVGNVYLQFDVDDAEFNVEVQLSGDTYFLVYDSDNDGDLSDETPTALTKGASDNLWYTATPVNFTNGQIFTLASKTYSPGSVSQNLQLWLRADKGFGTNNAAEWTDFFNGDSCTIIGATQTVNTHNFNPGVSFNGTSDYIDVYDGFSDFTAGMASFAVANAPRIGDYDRFYDFSGAGSGASVPDNCILLGNLTGAGQTTLYARTANGNTLSPSYPATAGIIEKDVDGLYGFNFTSYLTAGNSITSTILKNGKNVGSATMLGPGIVERSHNFISRSYNPGSGFWGGDIPEIIIYNRDISDIERRRVDTYLAIKYGLTLSMDNDGDGTSYGAVSGSSVIAEGDYIASDSTIIWDASAANLASGESYNNDIFGIGVDSISALDQRISKSINDTTVLSIAMDKDFTSPNDSTSRTAYFRNDKQFVALGSNDSSISFDQTTELPKYYLKRMAREWLVQKTDNFEQRVWLKFDSCYSSKDTTFYVLVDDDGDFSNAKELVALDKNGVSTVNVSLASGTYLTVVYRKDLVILPKVWYRADYGTGADVNSVPSSDGDIGAWYDFAGNNNTVTATAGQPTYTGNKINFNPTVIFNRADKDTMSLANPNLYSGFNARDIYIVAQSPKGGSVFYLGNNSPDNDALAFLADSAENKLFVPHSTDSSYVLRKYDDPFITNPYIYYCGVDNEKDQIDSTYFAGNASVITTYTSSYNLTAVDSVKIANDKRLYLGCLYEGSGNASHFYDGDVAEIMYYDTLSTSLNRQVIQSYLALKYGITMYQTDGSSQSYYSSGFSYSEPDSVIIWSALKAEVDTVNYNNDIFGIGRDDVFVLDQRVAKSQNADAILTISSGVADFDSTNLSNARTKLKDLSFEVIGNNGGDTCWTNAALIDTSVYEPHGFDLLGRVWQVQESAKSAADSVGNVYLQFELDNPGFDVAPLIDGNDYYFVYDSDRDGSLADEMPTKLTLNATGDTAVTDAINFKGGEIFTLATEADQCPGGVNGDNLWLRADIDAAVSLWKDYSGNHNDVSQDVAANQPAYDVDSLFNFNPVMNFDASSTAADDYMECAARNFGNGTGAREIYIVADADVRTDGIDYNVVFSLGGYATPNTTDFNNIFVNLRHNTVQEIYPYIVASFVNSSTPGVENALRSSFANTMAYSPALHEFTTPGAAMYNFNAGANGLLNGPNDNNATDTADIKGSGLLIGSRYVSSGIVGSDKFDGRIAEVIYYDEQHSDVERRKIESYLAVKYGLTLDSGRVDYLSSNGDTIWHTSANPIYNHNIFGLGLDSISVLDQRVSRSINDSTILTIALDDDFTSINSPSMRSPHAKDKQFLLVGDNGGTVTFDQDAELPAGNFNARMACEWLVQSTNFSQLVSLKFDGCNSSDIEKYYLVKDSDGNFVDGTIVGELGANGEITDITLSGGEYFTVVSYQFAPGGVIAEALWLKADYGVTQSGTVSQWDDFSGRGHTFLQATPGNQPSYNLPGMNFNPKIAFDQETGSSATVDYLDHDSVNIAGLYNSTAQSVFIVAERPSSSDLDYIYYLSDSIGADYDGNGDNNSILEFYMGFGDIDNNAQSVLQAGGSARKADANGATSNDSLPVLLSVTHQVNTLSLYGNSNFVASDIPSSVFLTDKACTYARIGGHQRDGNYDRFFTGNVSEIISYNSVLSPTNKQKVESYLAIKYGITLGVDYLASTGDTIWDAAANAPYSHDVFGIGTDSISTLDQKISNSSNDSAILVLSVDSGFTAPNLDAARSSLGDGNFVLTGNNGAGITFTKAFDHFSKQMDRNWVFDVGGTVDSVYIAIPNTILFPNGIPYIVLSSGDATFDTTDKLIPLKNDGAYYWVKVKPADKLYYTFVSKIRRIPMKYFMRHGKFFKGGKEQPMEW